MPNFFVDVRQDLVYAYGVPSRLVRPIWRVKQAPKRAYASFRRFSFAIAHHFWLIRIPTSKCQIFSWKSIKTLSMHTVGHHGLSDPFGGSNEPRSEHTPHFDDIRVLAHHFWVIRISMLKMPILSWTFFKTLSMHTDGHHGLSDPFGGSNDPRSEHTPYFDDFHVL